MRIVQGGLAPLSSGGNGSRKWVSTLRKFEIEYYDTVFKKTSHFYSCSIFGFSLRFNGHFPGEPGLASGP